MVLTALTIGTVLLLHVPNDVLLLGVFRFVLEILRAGVGGGGGLIFGGFGGASVGRPILQ